MAGVDFNLLRNEITMRRAQRAQQQGWNLAARQCERELRAVVGHLYGEFGILAQQLDTSLANDQPISTTRDIYHDLLALHDEFGKVSWDHPQRTLSAFGVGHVQSRKAKRSASDRLQSVS